MAEMTKNPKKSIEYWKKEKAGCQSYIETYEEAIASNQSKIEDPNTSERKRERLKNEIQKWESYVQNSKLQLDKCETEIKQIENNGT